MKRIILPLIASIGLFNSNLSAQQAEECASGKIHQRLMAMDPVYAQTIQERNMLIKQYSKNAVSNKSGTVFQIPVVVHIIHTGESVGTGANISTAQINSAITRLNDRYRNTHGSSVDTEIEFVLAIRDPDGNATTGINRVDGSGVTNYSADGVDAGGGTGADEETIKNLSRWPATQYYNIWVVTEIEGNNGGFGTQGYAYFPGARPALDGTIIMNTAFGTTGTVNSFNNQGRTLVHELGHGFNLYHTFEGDQDGTVCPSGNGDEVADTDPHIRAASNCPTGTNSCTGGSIDDLTSNFMNYSNQSCALEFTAGQVTRMRAAILASRPSLVTSLGGTTPASSAVIAATCTPTTSNTNNGFGLGIYKVAMSNIDVVSDGAVDEGGYIDHTKHQTLEVDAGTSYTLTVTTGAANNEDVRAYIDYNNDGDFADAGEEVFSSDNAINHSGTVTIPSSGIASDTLLRMRLISDFHSFTITDACYDPTYGQTEDYAIRITAVTPLTASISSQTNLNCNGDTSGAATVSASGGTSPYTYSWSNAATTAGISSVGAGTYTVTVADASGSTATASATITQPSAVVATSTSVTDVSCNGGSDGSITLSGTGGSSPYTYAWTNGTTTASNSNLTAGIYTVTITDANGCTGTSSSTVTEPNAILISLSSTNESCTGNDGTVTASASGGSNPYTYNWSNAATTANITNLSAGTYTVTVADANGCSDVSSVSISKDACAGDSLDLTLTTIYCGATNLDPIGPPIRYYTVQNASDYRVRVNGGGLSNVVHVSGNDNSFYLSQIGGIQYGQTYSVEIAAFVNGNWSTYGTPCNISTASLSSVNLTLTTTYCGATNLDPLGPPLRYYTRQDASNYRVRVNGGGLSNVVHVSGDNNSFYLQEIGGIQHGQTYTVEVAAFISGSWSGYGSSCTITTASLGSVNLTLTSTYCGITGVDPVYSGPIRYNTRSDATNYRVRVNGPGVSNEVLVSGNDNVFYLGQLSSTVQFGQTYTIEVAPFINGSWSNYGTACNVSTKALSSLDLTLTSTYCGATNLDANSGLLRYITRRDASNYRVRVNGAGVPNVVLVSGNDNVFYLRQVGGVQSNETYTVEVAAFINGSWSNYGTPCNVSTGPSLAPHLASIGGNNDGLQGDRIDANEVQRNLQLYPNPAKNETVYIKYNSLKNNAQITLELLDIRGRIVYSQVINVNGTELITTLEGRESLGAGIYFVKIKDDSNSTIKKLVLQ
jgi:hypothetical protein